jgi:hypothetical protein
VDVPCWIDPYGIDAPPAVVKFMRKAKNGAKAQYSKCMYQELQSENCGRFCARFIDELFKYHSLQKMDKGLSEKPSGRNEKKVGAIKL